MNRLAVFRLTQGVYWLSLGAWFGAVVMLVIAAAITFGTVRQFHPALGLEPYNHPSLVDRAAPILAGSVVGNMLKGLALIQSVCAASVIGCVVLQCTVFREHIQGGMRGWPNLLRVVLIAGPIAILAADRLVLTPRVWEQRNAMYDQNTSDEARSTAKGRFDRLHMLNERAVGASGIMLVGAVFVSAFALHGSERRSAITT